MECHSVQYQGNDCPCGEAGLVFILTLNHKKHAEWENYARKSKREAQNWAKLKKTDKNEGKTNIIVIIKNENPKKNLQAGEIHKNHGLYGQTLINH